jgi:hypothetical protein
MENDWLQNKEERCKQKKDDEKEAQPFEQNRILADAKRSKQQAVAMQEFMQSQFGVNQNDMFN